MCSKGQADLDLGYYGSSIAAEVEIPEIKKRKAPLKPCCGNSLSCVLLWLVWAAETLLQAHLNAENTQEVLGHLHRQKLWGWRTPAASQQPD